MKYIPLEFIQTGTNLGRYKRPVYVVKSIQYGRIGEVRHYMGEYLFFPQLTVLGMHRRELEQIAEFIFKLPEYSKGKRVS